MQTLTFGRSRSEHPIVYSTAGRRSRMRFLATRERIAPSGSLMLSRIAAPPNLRRSSWQHSRRSRQAPCGRPCRSRVAARMPLTFEVSFVLALSSKRPPRIDPQWTLGWVPKRPQARRSTPSRRGPPKRKVPRESKLRMPQVCRCTIQLDLRQMESQGTDGSCDVSA